MIAGFWAKVDKLQLWHAQLTNKSWLKPMMPTRWMVVLIVLAGLIAAGMNGYVRYWQYDVWEQNSQIFYLDDGTPLFTTTDAPYFLGVAQAIKQDGDFQSFNAMRQYPRIKKAFEVNPPEPNLRDTPLLSVVLSMMASDSSPKSLLEAGHRLIPVTAILTALMIICAFGAAGYWLEGSIAAAGGGLSLAYLQRSGAGRIDTDQLNLGFFYLMTGLVIWAARAKSERASIILAALTGTIFWVFDWWYSKPILGWCFFGCFLILSFVCRRKLNILLLQSILFLGLSGLVYKGLDISGDSAYFVDSFQIEGMVFPNTFDTITEIQHLQISDILGRLSGSILVGTFSLIGLGLWVIRHPVLAVPFFPAAAFVLLNFVIGNRAIFYSAPVFWFGFAWLLLTTMRYVSTKITYTKLIKSVVPLFMVIMFCFVWVASPTKYLQYPTFEKSIINHFQNLKDVLPKSELVIASWWDYGYMSMFMNGHPTFHDGGSQLTPITYIIANNLIRNSQEQAANEFHILSDFSYEKVIQNRLSGFGGTSETPTEVYLVLTKDMERWMPSISKIGAFDIKAGKPYQFDGVKTGYQLRYDKVECKPTDSNQEFICNGDRLNLASGQLGNNVILDGIAVSMDGRQTGGRKFPKANTPFVLHSEVGAAANRNLLLHRDLYFSVFHQLFYLNRADPKYFELVYDGFPDMRVFKVL